MAEVIEEKGHAKRGPSGAKARKLCPGKVVIEEGLPDRPSKYAAEGTVAHTLMELCLAETAEASQLGIYVAPKDAESFLGRMFEADGLEFEVTVEMADAVNEFISYVGTEIDCEAGDLLFIEQSVPIEHITGEGGATGTADVVGICRNGTKLVVLDLKYGQGVKVDCFDSIHGDRNEQFLEYGLGAMSMHDLTYDFKEVTIGVGQPRLHHFETDDLSMEDMANELSRLQTIEARCDEAEAHAEVLGVDETFVEEFLSPSYEACKFCRAKNGKCPALVGVVANVLVPASGITSAEEFEDLDLGHEAVKEGRKTVLSPPLGVSFAEHILLKAPLIELMLKAARAEVEAHVLSGGESDLFKVVEGKRGNRVWTDPIEVEAQLKASRVKVDEMFDYSLRSPTKLEEQFKEAKPRVWKKVSPLITQAEGKPSVVPMTDKRDAINPAADATDFADLGDDGSDLV